MNYKYVFRYLLSLTNTNYIKQTKRNNDVSVEYQIINGFMFVY